ncbi:MAG TPA: sugar-binding protein [Tepidisphaeraceae bacterium]|nr:sugar-binding protein [Tepidisphaeraceae bacterium]
MRNWITWPCIVLACLTLAVGCNKSESSATAQKKIRLAFITNNAADFWTICRAGCNKAAQENPDIDVDFQMLADASAAGQVRVIDDLLSRGVQGIALSPVDPTNETPKLNETAKSVVVFCADSDAPKSDRSCYIGTNNIDAGKQAGELIKQAIPSGGKIMIFVGTLDAQNARDRLSGIKQVLTDPKFQILDVRTDQTDTTRAKANAADTLVKYPDIACLVGLWSYNGPAILSAVRDAGKAGQVKIVCFDTDDETLAGVKNGDIFGTVVQQPFEFGRLSMINLAKVIGGDKSVIPESKQIFIPTLAITKDKIDEFVANQNKLLGK